VVVDISAVIAVLFAEPEHDRFIELLATTDITPADA
jgi:uncharacterized protein with PIN domain